MDAIILAAGDGKRMRPLTADVPKPLLSVGGRSLLEHSILALRECGITRFHLLVGWKAKYIQEQLGDGSELGIHIDYTKQGERKGTAHAIGMFSKTIRDDFLCLNGDVLIRESHITRLLDMYHERGAHLMTLARVPDPSNFGAVVLDPSSRVEQIIEKPLRPVTDTVNAGIYILSPEIFKAIKGTPTSPRGEYEITTTLQMLAEEGKVSGVILDGPWMDIGHPWDLLDANELLLAQTPGLIEGTVEECVHVNGTLICSKGAVIKSGTYIEGTVFIGEGTVIGPNAYIRGTTSIGKGCKVGAASEVKNSVIMDDTNIPHHNYVGDSVIGRGCNLGSGTKVANLRLDHGNIRMVSKGVLCDTGRRKLGVIMGDRVQTGINVSINVGTVIGGGTFIGPGRSVSGAIGPGSRLY